VDREEFIRLSNFSKILRINGLTVFEQYTRHQIQVEWSTIQFYLPTGTYDNPSKKEVYTVCNLALKRTYTDCHYISIMRRRAIVTCFHRLRKILAATDSKIIARLEQL
jgi:hypothetical protein